MRFVFLGSIALLALSACDGKVSWSDNDTVGNDVEISMRAGDARDRLSLKLPVLDADIALPNLELGRDVDLNGMKLAPDTRVRSLDVTGKDAEGQVRIGFTHPRPPANLLAYYREAAANAGYRDIAAGTTTLKARKEDSALALTLRPNGAGSSGTITLTDSE
jgi:hypothetical protein